ncbi:MAG: DUF4432 family protein [Actinobacteria bacterium]|nr:DUF4432 family protein [Actinomycetota bacterium]
MSALRRNTGCRINDEISYKGLKSVIMENELLRLFILADKGTDIIELLYKPKDIDFMWKSPKDFKEGQIDRKDFLESYLGGWQEIIPNGGPPCIYKGASFGLHDESPMVKWDFEIIKDSEKEISIKFFTKLSKMPLGIEKVLSLTRGSAILSIQEKVTNFSKEPLDFMWGHHPCFGSPFLSGDCIINFDAEEIISNQDSISNFPLVAPKASGSLKSFPGIGKDTVDLSKVMPKEANCADLLYARGLRQNWFSITNLEEKTGIGFVFDLSVFKYLYYWLVYGGSDNYPWYSDTYSLAIEPWSSYPGLGLIECIKNKTSLKINPGEIKSSWLKVVVFERSTDVNKIDNEAIVY